MTRLVVECGFGSTVFTAPASITWTEITQYVDVHDQGVSISRGASDERSDIQVGTCTLRLDNSDGRFSAGLASSPYYPNVRKGTPLRVRVITTAKNLMPNPSFESGVTAWTSSGTPTRAASATHVQDGASAMLITWGGVASQTMTSPVVQGLEVGSRYTFSAYVWVPAGHTPVQLTVAGVTTGAQSTVTAAFQRLTVSWTATATSHQVRVAAIGTPTVGHQTWVDACQIEEGSSATTYSGTEPRTHDRFWGGVNEWPTKWKGLYATAVITCSDLLLALGRQPALRSCLEEEVLRTGPIAYYPLTEPAESVTAGDLSGITAGSLGIVQVSTGGTAAFGSGTGPAATGESVLLLTPVGTSQGKYFSADLGAQYQARSDSGWNNFECWFQTSTVSRVLFAVSSTDGQYVIVFALSAGGALQIESTNDGSALTTASVTSGNLADDVMHHVVYDENANTVHVDGVSVTVGAVPPMFRLRTLRVGGYANTRLFSGSISHLALYTIPSGNLGPTLAAHYAAGATAFEGEDADVRQQRLAGYAGIGTVSVVGVTHDPMAGQGPGGSTALARMKEVERTESGHLFAERDYFGLSYQSRDVRYNPDPASEVFTIAYADTESDELEIRDDDQKLINTVVASRPAGATQRVINTASRAAYGVYQQDLNLLKTSDGSVLDAANWMVSRFADPPPELREVPIEAYSLAAYPDILDGDISELFSVTSMPAQSLASTLRVTIEGYSETIKYRSHRIQFHTSRSDTDSVWVLGDPVYSVLGSTTRLAY